MNEKARRPPKVRQNPHTEKAALDQIKAVYSAGVSFKKKDAYTYEVLDSNNKVIDTLSVRQIGDVVTIVIDRSE